MNAEVAMKDGNVKKGGSLSITNIESWLKDEAAWIAEVEKIGEKPQARTLWQRELTEYTSFVYKSPTLLLRLYTSYFNLHFLF
jgi:hypothetical protein